MRKMFSENQIKKMVSESSAEVVEALQNQDVKVKTIEQSEANWYVDVETFPSSTNCTSSPIFCRIQKINQELHIIMLGKITNPTESNIDIYSTDVLQVELPEEISTKIYDILGNNVKGTPVSNVRVSCNFASVFGDGATTSDMSKYMSDAVMSILNLPTKNKIGIQFARPSAIQLKAGKDTFFESRVSLDLI